MNKELTLKPEERSVSIIENYTNEQVAVIKQHVAVGATNDELIYFLQVCKQQNLDPLSKQIYFVKRGGQMSIQTGIDGYRAMAEQTGRLAGIDEPVYEDGTPYPRKAAVTVYKFVQGNKVSFTASARWQEYFPGEKLGFMWKKMPYLMLGKVAEALALRKAFPKNLGGVYTDDEMTSAQYSKVETRTNADNLIEQKEEETGITKQQIQKIKHLIKERGKDLSNMLKYYKIEKLEDFTFEGAEGAIKILESSPVTKETKEEETQDVVVDGDVIEEMPPQTNINSKSTKPLIIAEINKIAKEKRQFVSPMLKKLNKTKLEDLTKDELIVVLEELGETVTKVGDDAIGVGLPEDVCQIINWYSDIEKEQWPQAIIELNEDANQGKFRGYDAYAGLKEEIAKLPKQ